MLTLLAARAAAAAAAGPAATQVLAELAGVGGLMEDMVRILMEKTQERAEMARGKRLITLIITPIRKRFMAAAAVVAPV